jgi:hypothetical protein
MPLLKDLLFTLEFYLKVIFLPSTIVFASISNYLVLAISILALYRKHKRPRFNKEYGYKVITDEFAHNLFYMIPFVFFPASRNLVYFMPLMIHALVGIANYYKIK